MTPSPQASTIETRLSATALLDRQYHEMRWRLLSLAADLDRLHRAPGHTDALTDPRLLRLLDAARILTTPTPTPDRAERLQLLLSDRTPPPAEIANRKSQIADTPCP